MTQPPRTRRELLDIVSKPPAPTSAAAQAVMRQNRRRDSRPEVQLRSGLHRRGLRFRVDLPIRCGNGRPVRPDIVFPRAHVVVFVDGCFWHGCPIHGKPPKSNARYWDAKIALNQDRDTRQSAALNANGWTVLRIWEHEPVEQAISAVEDAVVAAHATASAGTSASAPRTD